MYYLYQSLWDHSAEENRFNGRDWKCPHPRIACWPGGEGAHLEDVGLNSLGKSGN